MDTPQVLESTSDESVNFIWHLEDGQIEARYVRRRVDRYICYLSVMTGCGLGCKMCHLTQTRQTRARDLTAEEIVEQAATVVAWVQASVVEGKIPSVTGVDFSFMARGDFFANQEVLNHADELLASLDGLASEVGLTSRVKISTIMPRSLGERSLESIFRQARPDIYYSLYCMRTKFRKTWLPRAMDPRQALSVLHEWQQESRKIVVLHGAFIADQNDGRQDILDMGAAVRDAKLRVDFNVVRYNPYSEVEGIETRWLSSCTDWLEVAFPYSQVKVVSRVGPDVYASCGMFMPS